ncbi:MAG: histidine kinase dimerization/phosphoacceptor domain -containing protein [Gracilimonas sp.]
MKDSLSKEEQGNADDFLKWKKRINTQANSSQYWGMNNADGKSLKIGPDHFENWSDMHDISLPLNVMKSLFDERTKSGKNSENLNLTDKKFAKILELSPAMIIITDRWGEFEYANPVFLKTVGYTRKEILGRGPGFLSSDITSIDKFYELQEAILKGTTWKGELIKRNKNGGKFIFSASVSPVENEMGLITNFIIVGQDITPFRETQEELKKALEEKNVLLSELHHRVKNNLAVVSGLMQLQAFNEEDETIQDKLFSSAGRIKAMSSMHELLYESNSLKRIRFDSVIEKVVQYVSGMYKKKSRIKLKWNLEKVKMNINQAHPSTLIIYEVISNAYKHAFDCGEDGLIEIKLYKRGTLVFISVSDSGRGMPQDYQTLGQRKSTTGYELLNSLVNQLDGYFSYESDQYGTNFFFHFEMEDTNGICNGNLSDIP